MKKFFTRRKVKAPALILILLMIMQAGFGTAATTGKAVSDVQNDCQLTLAPLTSSYRYIVRNWETTFTLKVDNKGTTAETIALSVKNNNVNCKNPDDSGNANNVELELQLQDVVTLQPVANVTLQPGENYTFIVRVKVPQQKALLAWNCAEVKAIPVDCPSSELTCKVYSYVDSPDAE